MSRPLLQMNPRERRLVGILSVAAAFLLICAVPFGLEVFVQSARADNEELRQALADVQDARGRVRDRQQRKDAIAARYEHKAPSLAGYLEQTARAQKLEVTDSTPLPDVPHGKRYSEHGTNIHLKKAGLFPVTKFLEAIEKSGYPVVVSRLNVRKRSGESDSYDVEVGVSSFDKVETPPPPSAPENKP